MAKQALSRDSLDFSRPWDLRLVDEHRFHVHRSILAMWSPVFKTNVYLYSRVQRENRLGNSSSKKESERNPRNVTGDLSSFLKTH